jgi:alpha-L-arabinofuranosidase
MAIPEFVLRKLVLPGSLKKQGNGFSFIINNTFAPATINRFELLSNNVLIPPETVSFSTPDKPAQKGSEITAENPLLTPVGVEILVVVENQPLTDNIVVKGMTKEVGEIVFSLTKSKVKTKVRQIKPYFLTQFWKPLDASLSIDLDQQSKDPASPFLLGQFVEHLERCVYDGIWASDGSTLREDTLDLLKQLNPPLIRYPGGNFASGYHWEDGIGPKSKRPYRHDAAWQADESNLVGTDEFLTFCEQMNIEPLLVVNDGSGSAEEAARWVAYCNDPESTEQGKRRAANGHANPYNVKYWGIGNEVWGAWQIGTTSAEEYTRRLLRFIKAMRAVDPSIKLVAVGNHPLTSDEKDPAALWNKEVLSKAGDQIEYLSWHIYQPEKDGWADLPDPIELFKSVCAAPLDIDLYTKRIEKEIAQYSPNKKVLQALDEWNVWLPPLPGETSMHQVTYTMRDALYVASALAVFYRNSHTLGMTNLAQLVNVLPLIKTNANTAIATTLFFPFIIFNQMEDRVVQSSSQSPVFSSKAMGENISAHEEVPWLDQLVTASADQDHITVLLVNRHPENRLNVKFSLEMPFAGSLEIAASHPLDANTFAHPNKVKIVEGPKIKKKGSNWQVMLKPASIVYLEFKRI